MYICYVDESGTPEVPGNTSHFVLAGIAIPISKWREADGQVGAIMAKYGLAGKELHTAWVLRAYLEQSRIPRFEKLDLVARRSAVLRERNANLLRLQRSGNRKQYNQTKKNYVHTDDYIHLTHVDRQSLVQEIAECVGTWSFARLFCEAIDKVYFDPAKTGRSVDEQAFEQVVSRFEQYLQKVETGEGTGYGILVHDNNETVARKHTSLMRSFHEKGTLWTDVQRIIETPLFVDSSLTSMVQVADLCSYAIRRYLENGERSLFDAIFPRADRARGVVVGARHYTGGCSCSICSGHRHKF